MRTCTMGIDVGGTKLAYGLFDEEQRCVLSRVTPSMPEAEPIDMIDAMISEVDGILSEVGLGRADLAGLGLALPSYIDTRQGRIIRSSNLPKWFDLPVRELVRERLDVPLALENDANTAAIAEQRLGAGKGCPNMIYVTVSTGVGGGLILNDRIYHGSYGAAGEIGHIPISELGDNVCGCGLTGCVESFVSGPHIVEFVEKRIAAGETSLLETIADGKPITTRHIAEAFARGDALALRALDRVSEYLARMFVALYQVLNVDRVVYGGGALKISPILMERAEARFLDMLPMARAYPVTFLPAALGDDVGMIGAGLIAREYAV